MNRTPRLPWWTYNAGLVVLAIAVFGVSRLFHPGEDPRWVYLPNGMQFGDTCAFLAVTGLPCPQCGMTRSWVWAARGHLATAFLYSPGGLGLFLWAQVAGVFGAIRLLRRDPDALELPWQVVVGWTLVWMLGLYVLPYVLRLNGINPLP